MFKSYEMYAFELSSDFNVMKFLALKFFFTMDLVSDEGKVIN